jgi:putative membrane protein insertion efficiency factor
MSGLADRSAGALSTRMLHALSEALRHSPWLGNACRFEPTCSRYAIDALETHGAGVGSYVALRRLGRCHPWCDGGFDPVPLQAPSLFAGLCRPASPRDDSAPCRGVLFPTSTDKNTP